MGLLKKVQNKRNELVFEVLAKKISGHLATFCGGMPLADGEKEMVVVLLPRKDDTTVCLVAINERGQIVRVAARYSGVELAALVSGKLKAAGVDLNGIDTASAMVEPLNETNNERIG